MLMDRWYLGVFLLGFGLWRMLGARRAANLRRYFSAQERTPEVEAALARRQALEALPLGAWYVPGAVNVLLGIAVLTGMIEGIAAYGLGMCAFAVSLGFAYSRMRNNGIRRAAALQPRTLTSIVPFAWYPAAAAASVSPLAFLDAPGYGLASICVCVASVATFVVAALSNNMAALMTGDDPNAELQVEARLRCARVKELFAIGMAVPFVFVAMVSPYVPSSPLRIVAYCAAIAAWFAFMIPLLRHRFRVAEFL
jgi:hypothetical protein